MKMSNFENPTWRTAAILKTVISPYLSLGSSEYDEIWYAYAYFDRIDGNVRKIQKFPNSRWRTDAILKIIFWLWSDEDEIWNEKAKSHAYGG